MEFTLQQAREATGARGSDASTLVTGVSTDTRSIRPGDLYVPLVGARFDGHDFVQDAIDRGAVAVLSSRLGGPPLSVPVLEVANTLKAYQQLGAFHRRRLSRCRVVAITGSNGKTLTKDLTAHLLAGRYRVIKTEANLNNEIGVPQTLFRLDPGTDIAVLEMAMRGRGQIEELAVLADAQVGVITNVGEAHLELLGSREAIADTKAELLDNLAPGGTAVLDGDSPWFQRLRSRARGPVVTFGSSPGSAVRLLDYEPQGWNGSLLRIEIQGRAVQAVNFPLLGRHLANNLLAALGACVALDAPVEDIDGALVGFRATGHRLELGWTAGGVAVINDAYNASPLSIRGALDLLPDLPPGRRIAVLGDMLELGPTEESAHREMGQIAALRGVDVLVAAGQRGAWIADSFEAETDGKRQILRVANAQEAADATARLVTSGDVVLVKASHGMALEAVVRRLMA